MSRKFDPITEEEFFQEIKKAWERSSYYDDENPTHRPWWYKQQHGDDWQPETHDDHIACWNEFHPTELTDQIEMDLKKVEFDLENIEYTARDAYKGLKDIVGFHTLPNGMPYLGIIAGGDWEFPIFFMIYWDGKKLRGYIPTKGNPWNRKAKSAYGNDEESDTADIKRILSEMGKPVPDDDYLEAHDHLDHDTQAIIEDIMERIQPRQADEAKSLPVDVDAVLDALTGMGYEINRADLVSALGV